MRLSLFWMNRAAPFGSALVPLVGQHDPLIFMVIDKQPVINYVIFASLLPQCLLMKI